jgi:hypothetical protein
MGWGDRPDGHDCSFGAMSLTSEEIAQTPIGFISSSRFRFVRRDDPGLVRGHPSHDFLRPAPSAWRHSGKPKSAIDATTPYISSG